jgi:2-polyprenyl-3-methyl-5-hydroxy-6-metoxy-1,4-benzoquinol methylase
MSAIDPAVRQRRCELMDDPTLDVTVHRQALAGLGRVNWWSRTESVLWKAISIITPIADGPLRILDIASGGGDAAIGLAQRCQRSGQQVQIWGWDISPQAVRFATEQAQAAGLQNVTFAVRDAIEGTASGASFDVVMCTLFLHHLDPDDAIQLLMRMRSLATQQILVDDLRRTRLGYWLAWAGCRILTRSHVVHVDGPLSVGGAFTPDEALQLAHQAGLKTATIRNHWPQRFLLSAQVSHVD